MEPVRAFIAVELPETVRSALSGLQNRLKEGERAPVKWVNPESVHLTLKFLGNIDLESIPQLSEAISEASRGNAPFRLELSELGGFPNLRAPRVLWVGLRGETASLSALQKNVESALIPLGFPPEKKGFSPHLTLGRVREKATSGDRYRLGKAASSLEAVFLPSFTVDSLNLMRSRLSREGAIYSRLQAFSLEGG